MKIRLVTPAPRGSRVGNQITATRWARLLRQLGHEVVVEREYNGGSAEVLVALHARKSHASVVRFVRLVPEGRVIVALTGTDLYIDLARSRQARQSVRLADRLVVLQPLATRMLPRRERSKAKVILQSAMAPARTPPRRTDVFEVCVLGHLRPVKDPFRAALAMHGLPAQSRLVVTHVGAALDPTMRRRAEAEMKRNDRYRWVGARPRAQALRLLARSRALVLTSLSEGGANAISEAVVCGVPVIASRIDGSVGLLGRGYPGYFEVGDTAGLAHLLARLEDEPAFARRLQRWCAKLAPRFAPRAEQDAWKNLLRELDGPA